MNGYASLVLGFATLGFAQFFHTQGEVVSDWIGKTAPELAGGEWVNAAPVRLSDLRGRVVLLEFWTYGCYNCRNTIPTLNRWQKTYRDRQFTIIGVHTPEFDSERSLRRVKENVAKLGIEYAVVTDNEYATWRAYDQHYWPVLYLIDKKGVVRYVRIGEGAYDTTERMIGALLKE